MLRRELPGDNEVVESLLRAQVALKKLVQEEVHDTKEEVASLDWFKAAISSPGDSLS